MMAILNMDGPFILTNEEVDKQITRVSCGNYALGYVKDGGFYVQYVGRADENLNQRVKQHCKEPYEFFKFSYATSPRDAYLKECRNYHDFSELGKINNKIHPDQPKNANWKCPACG
jgi:hypothetical protein